MKILSSRTVRTVSPSRSVRIVINAVDYADHDHIAMRRPPATRCSALLTISFSRAADPQMPSRDRHLSEAYDHSAAPIATDSKHFPDDRASTDA